VCNNNGTEAPPIGTAKIGNHTVIFAPIAIRQTNTPLKVKAIGRNFFIYNFPPFHLIISRVEIRYQPNNKHVNNKNSPSIWKDYYVVEYNYSLAVSSAISIISLNVVWRSSADVSSPVNI